MRLGRSCARQPQAGLLERLPHHTCLSPTAPRVRRAHARPSGLGRPAPAAARRGSTRAAPSSLPRPWTGRSPGDASRSSATGRGGGRPPSPTRQQEGFDHPDLTVGGASGRAAGRPARHALRSQSKGSGGSARRIVTGRSVVAGLSLSPRPDRPSFRAQSPLPGGRARAEGFAPTTLRVEAQDARPEGRVPAPRLRRGGQREREVGHPGRRSVRRRLRRSRASQRPTSSPTGPATTPSTPVPRPPSGRVTGELHRLPCLRAVPHLTLVTLECSPVDIMRSVIGEGGRVYSPRVLRLRSQSSTPIGDLAPTAGQRRATLTFSTVVPFLRC